MVDKYLYEILACQTLYECWRKSKSNPEQKGTYSSKEDEKSTQVTEDNSKLQGQPKSILVSEILAAYR
ncbi:hypothetical protein CHS0354_027565 [Potamilus streckersoni]|uniref:Uncharacterized protein n=1 Tax=Potamilus streckersoni TaxID=2493646 RepID=A0AAE0VMA2_9BIVA|nr:hypothetical protein CHS0354_027565 [Potamilus streckersoni]